MKKLALIPVLLGVISFVQAAQADITLRLKRDFIEEYKHRVLIETKCFLDQAKKRPNPKSKDGDIHIAVRCPGDVDLNVVAEIMNAADKGEWTQADEALVFVQDKIGEELLVPTAGFWRFWPEHGGGHGGSDDDESEDKPNHSQFDPPTERLSSTNPPHLFEIHPVTNLAGMDLSNTLHEVTGYTTKDAHDAFFRYEQARFVIKSNPAKPYVDMSFSGVGYNYVEFILETREQNGCFDQVDGCTAFTSIRDLDGELLVRKVRVAFASGTAPYDKAKSLSKGQCMHVLGLPRFSLALISWRVNQADEHGRSDVLSWSLPYEMIIAADYDDLEENRCP